LIWSPIDELLMTNGTYDKLTISAVYKLSYDKLKTNL